ncbi:hypothetical protein B296_00038046 [Ensete ventricosum]|uniref:Uncharacterized protein n=1 Tax=Ensete ventricosum TaxID=4639 RepID=A0A426XI28_ENSVE|nr:hypothetical protein B296_00038046 [Ensete ventricosum]
MAATSSLLRTTGPSTWPTQCGKLVRRRSQRSTRAGILQPDPSSTIPVADFPSRTSRYHPSDRAPTPHRDDRGWASAHGPEPAVLAQQARRRNSSTRQAPDLTLTSLALEGGPEPLFGDSSMEHHPELDHPRPTEEATVAVLTPNRF